MKDKNTIEYLAYLLNASKDKNNEKAIFFIGAGFSVSAGIPLTNVIVRHIRFKFIKNPCIQNIDDKNNYYELMGALTADERRDLFHFYVTRKKVKLNLASIYLAQLLREGYIDYIVTVNFDDLILKASTLYNFLPPVYDMSNIKTETTTDIRTGSVIYLHGQYFGQWLLNDKAELKKVETEVANLFNTIKTRRTWVIVGYSGNDGIFEKIKKLGSFSSELFWVKKEFRSEDKHITDFLETSNTNANKIEGEYSDSFFLKLHAELSKLNVGLTPPDILYKPFTYLKNVLEDVSINDSKTNVGNNPSSLLMICHSRLDKAINEYELDYTLENLQQVIIAAIIKNDFSDKKAIEFKEKIDSDKKYKNANEQLSWYYGDWGNALSELAEQNGDENLYKLSFEKYKTASELNPKDYSIFYNWGIALSDLAKLNDDENLFKESFEKYKTASELNPQDNFIFYNWGIALSDLAKLKEDENLYIESFQKYQTASELNPKEYSIFNNWGISIYQLAKQNDDENLYKESSEKYQIASELNPKDYSIFYNWGIALYHLAILNDDVNLYKESFEKYQIASDLNPKEYSIFNNWGSALTELAKQNDDENLYIESFKKYQTASELNPKDDSIYNNWGISIYQLAKQNDDENLYKESSEKYQIASELNPKNDKTFYNWGTTLMHFAKLKNNDKDLYKEAEDVLQKGEDLGGGVYNLACMFALQNKNEKAFYYLQKSLQNKEISIKEIEEDEDWNNLREEIDYKELIKKYS